ncbi:cellulose-binding protein, partial [Streptomyces sp. TRM76130]|nr:cellulose-binding protein [Streptomyces sp. TRM76130]
RRAVKAGRGAVLGVLREARRRTAGILAEQAGEHAARWAAAERQDVERAAAVEARAAESLARAERLLADAGRDLADAEESARRLLEEARGRAADVLAGARAYEERVARETERVLREHGERWDAVQAQTDQVRSRLSA